MNFAWFAVILCALFAAVSASGCPAKFKSVKGKCITDRTIRGECPAGSTYKIGVNACVYGA